MMLHASNVVGVAWLPTSLPPTFWPEVGESDGPEADRQLESLVTAWATFFDPLGLHNTWNPDSTDPIVRDADTSAFSAAAYPAAPDDVDAAAAKVEAASPERTPRYSARLASERKG